MISHQGSSFAADLGYKTETGYRPGVSVFVLKDGVPYRQSDTACFPWDDFNPLWHLFDMAPGCADGWRPKSCYDATQS